MKKIYLLSILVLILLSSAKAQTGTDFWFAAPEVTTGHNDAGPKFRFTNISQTLIAHVTVTMPAQPWTHFNPGTPPNPLINIPANGTYTLVLDVAPNSFKDTIENKPTNTVLKKGIHITSDVPITVYYEVDNSNNNEIFALKGANALGTEFYIPLTTNPNIFNHTTLTPPAYSTFDIVATQDNTIIQIYTRVPVDGHPANTPFSITLNKGQTYSCGWTGTGNDLSINHPAGSVVLSNKPIAITVKEDSQQHTGWTCYDLFGDQIVPTDIIGTDYIIIKGQLNGTAGESYSILATENNTNVYVNGNATPVATLFAGQTYYQDNITLARYYIHTDKPVYCTQITGYGCELGSAILPALNCAGSSSVSFVRSTTQAFYLNIMVKNGSQGNFTLYGGSNPNCITAADFAVVPGTGGEWYSTYNKSFTTAEVPQGSVMRLTNSTNVFGMGIFNGNGNTGVRYGFFSEYVAKITTNAGPDQSVCANTNATLNGSVSGGSTTGIWSCTGTGTFVPNNNALNATYIPSLADITNHAVDFTLTSTGICYPVADQMHMTLTNAPIVIAGADQTVCSNSPNVNLNGSITLASGGQWTGGAGSYSPDNHTLITTYTPTATEIANGTVTLTLTSFPYSNCNDVSDQITISIIQGPVVDAGPNKTACANNPVVTLGGSVGYAGGGVWSGGAGTFNPSNTALNATYTATPTEVSNGFVNLTLTSTGNGICNAMSDGMSISFTIAPIVNAGVDQTVCSNRTVSLNGSVSGATGGRWSGGLGLFTPNVTTLNAVYTPTAAELLSGVLNLTLTSEGNGTCNPVLDVVKIDFSPSPTADAGSDQTRCSNNANVPLNGGVTISGGGQWSGGLGSFVPSPTTLNATYVPTAAEITAGTVNLILTTINNYGCNPVTDDMTVTFTQGPVVSAGIDKSACANNPTVTLAGSVSYATGGIWSGGLGAYNPSNTTLNASYTPTPGEIASGTVILTLTSTGNGSCNPSSSSMSINYTSAPTANAGPDQTVCANRTIQLSGLVVGASGGVWSGGLGLFSPNAHSLTAIYTPTANEILSGEVNLTLTTTGNGTCSPVIDNIRIELSPAPTANAGSDQTLCANNSNVSLNGVVTIATGGRWTTSGSGYFTPNNTSLATTYVPSATDLSVGSIKLYLTTTNNGTCLSASDSLNVFFTLAPIVNAGPDQTVCPDNLNIPMNGNVSGGASTGIWTTTGTGTFSPSNTVLNPTYIASAQDVTNLGATLTLSATNYNNCNPASDQVRVNIYPAGTANAGADQTVCANNINVYLHGIIGGSAVGGVWSSTGTGVFSPNPTNLSATYIPSAGDIVNGSVVIRLTANSCDNAFDELNVDINPAPIADAGPDQTVCVSNLLVQLAGTITGGSITGTWTTSGNGFFTPNATTLNAVYHVSSQDSLIGHIKLFLTSTNNGSCIPAKDTMDLHISPPGVVNVGADISVCSNNANVQLTGIISGGAFTGKWTTNGTGYFAPNNTTLNAVYHSSNQDIFNGFVTLTLTATNSCNSASDNLMVTYTPGPTVNAGGDQTLCGNNANTYLSGAYTVAGGIVWSSSGTGSFNPSITNLTPTYIPSAADIADGSVYIYLTTTGNGNCNASVDSLLLTFSPSPLVDAGPDQSVCKSSMETKMLGSVSGGATSGHWTTTGSGTFANPDDLNTVYSFSNADTSAGSISITLTSTNNGDCIPVSDNATLTFTNSAFAFAGYDRSVCSTDLGYVQLNGFVSGGATTGIWSTMGSGTFTPNNTTLNAVYQFGQSDSLAGYVNLILTTTNSGSCLPGVDTIRITVEKLAIVNAGPDQTVCAGIDFVDVYGLVTYGTGGTWTTLGSGHFTHPNLLNSQYVPSIGDSIAGNVKLVLTSRGFVNCNAQKDTLEVFLTNVINPDFTYNAPCLGVEVSFNENCQVFSGDISAYTWIFDGGNVVHVQNPSFTFATTGNHTVTLTVTSNLGCTYTITKTIVVNSTPFANFSTNAECFKDYILFSDLSTVAAGSNIVSWNWNFGDSYISNESNPIHKYANEGTFIVSLLVTTNSGCEDSITRIITALPSPTANYSTTGGCVNDTIHFIDESLFPSGTISNWIWDFGGGATSVHRDTSHVWNTEGIYPVSLVVISDHGCTDTIVKLITVSQRPIPGFMVVADTNLIVNEIIQFTDSSFYSDGWIWDFGDNSDTSRRENPNHIYFKPGVYSVTQTVYNGTCPASIIKQIVIKGTKEVYPPKVPTGFSPNNDGINDTLYVRGGPFSSLQFIIYNKWGEKIFESNNPEIGWDGTRKGKKEPVGVYLWTFNAVTLDGKIYTKSGEVTIIR
ncbi:MAG: hypothetical protein AUJ97_04365 [Bacteroidetes bacterium CG2_30_32_10]|nr:MAG: hypothetical protein AUJ97_04365 [Bacteroidetes bacterium CG2_30_32_10]